MFMTLWPRLMLFLGAPCNEPGGVALGSGLRHHDSRCLISKLTGPKIPDSRFPDLHAQVSGDSISPDLQAVSFQIPELRALSKGPGFQIPDSWKSGIWKLRACKSGNLESGISGNLRRANLEIWKPMSCRKPEIRQSRISKAADIYPGGGRRAERERERDIYIYIYIYIYTYTHTHMRAVPCHVTVCRRYVLACACMYVCVYVCMYVCMYVRTVYVHVGKSMDTSTYISQLLLDISRTLRQPC